MNGREPGVTSDIFLHGNISMNRGTHFYREDLQISSSAKKGM